MRFLLLSIAALLALAGGPQALIAAPRLNPVAIESTVAIFSPSPFNPAVLPWSGPSRIGGAVAKVESDVTTAGTTLPLGEGEGRMVQGRWVGETLAVSAEAFTRELDLDPLTFGPGTVEFDSSLVGVAFQVGEIFSLGAGRQSFELSGNSPDVTTRTLPVAGATLRVREVIYLGAASGDETVEDISTQEGDRTVTRFGVAYHWRDGDTGLHVEVYRQEIDAIATPITEEEQESVGFTVEVVFANILIAFESFETESTDNTGAVTSEDKATTVSLGWAPSQGLAIVASLVELELNDISAGQLFTFDTQSIGIAWLF